MVCNLTNEILAKFLNESIEFAYCLRMDATGKDEGSQLTVASYLKVTFKTNYKLRTFGHPFYGQTRADGNYFDNTFGPL